MSSGLRSSSAVRRGAYFLTGWLAVTVDESGQRSCRSLCWRRPQRSERPQYVTSEGPQKVLVNRISGCLHKQRHKSEDAEKDAQHLGAPRSTMVCRSIQTAVHRSPAAGSQREDEAPRLPCSRIRVSSTVTRRRPPPYLRRRGFFPRLEEQRA